MSTSTRIEWTDVTWNPVVGCTRVSEGCRNCYAEHMSARLAMMAWRDDESMRDPGRKDHYRGVIKWKYGEPIALPQWNNEIELVPEALEDPLRWRKPRRVFVNSMSDLFHDGVPFEYVDRVMGVIERCPQHTFQILTKRPQTMADYANRWRRMKTADLPANAWLGTSIENQATADERIPYLLSCDAAVRWLSIEPMLGGIDLDPNLCDVCGEPPDGVSNDLQPWCNECANECGSPGWLDSIDWVVIGCESIGSGRVGRLDLEDKGFSDFDWRQRAERLVKQCQDAGVPVFVKQIPVGRKVSKLPALDEWPLALRVRQYPQPDGAHHDQENQVPRGSGHQGGAAMDRQAAHPLSGGRRHRKAAHTA